MFYSPIFRYVGAVSGVGGHILGILGEEPLFKAGVSSLPSHEYLPSLCLCDERGSQLVLPHTKGRYVSCKGCIGPPHLCAKILKMFSVTVDDCRLAPAGVWATEANERARTMGGRSQRSACNEKRGYHYQRTHALRATLQRAKPNEAFGAARKTSPLKCDGNEMERKAESTIMEKGRENEPI